MTFGCLVTGACSSRRSGTTASERRSVPRCTSTVIGRAGLRRATRAKSCHDITVSPFTLRIRSPGLSPAFAPALPLATVEMTGPR